MKTILKFTNIEEFNARWRRTTDNGTVVKVDKILLACFRDKGWRDYLRKHEEMRCFFLERLHSVNDLYFWAINELDCTCEHFPNIILMGYSFYSPEFYTDDYRGICLDGSTAFVRYKRQDNDKEYKMRIGKMIRHLCDSHDVCKHFPEALKTHLGERFGEEWQAYAASKSDHLKLSLDVTFADIYGDGEIDCCSGFGSCMQGEGYHTFYEDAVKASPAALINAEGLIAARCVIFDEVTDEETGEKLRLAERQYAEGEDLVLKKILVQKLIEAGRIDGFKAVGAGCHSPMNFLRNDGSSLSHQMHIECDLDEGDTLSYQDSFKYYDFEERIAYNYDAAGHYDENLCETDGVFRGGNGGNYDDYNEEWTDDDLVTVYVNGNPMTCSEYRLDDFRWIQSLQEYHHCDDVTQCERCDEYVLDCDAVYSELTGEYYCCDDCLEDAESEWRKENWEYSVWDNEYYEHVVSCHEYGVDNEYHSITISQDSLDWLLGRKSAIEYEGEFYIDYNRETRLPYGVEIDEYIPA